MKCKYCKSEKFKESGFKGYNRRYTCLFCGAVKIDKDSESYLGFYPEWSTKEEWKR